MSSWTQYSEGDVSGRLLWRLSMYLFCDTLVITVSEACIETVACEYGGGGQPGRLRVDSSVKCWEGNHRVAAAFALFILMWYISTTILYVAKYGISSERLDLQFSALYITLNNTIKVLMVVATVILGSKSDKVLPSGILLGLNVAGLAAVLLFQRGTGYALANTPTACTCKRGAYAATTAIALAAFVGALIDDRASPVPIAIWLGSWGLIAIVLARTVWRAKPPLSDDEIARNEFRKGMLGLEEDLVKSGLMLKGYSKARKALRWKIRNARVPRTFTRQEYEEGANQNLCGLAPFLGLPLEARDGGGRFGGRANGFEVPADVSIANVDTPVHTTASQIGDIFRRRTTEMLQSIFHGPDQTVDSAVQPEDHGLQRTSSRTNSYTIALDFDPNDSDVHSGGDDLPRYTPGEHRDPPPQHAVDSAAAGQTLQLPGYSQDEGSPASAASPPSLPPRNVVEETNRALLEPLGMPSGAAGYSYQDDMPNDADRFDGQTCLLLLERYVRFGTLSLVFLGRVHEWRGSVAQSNWAGLLLCFQALRDHIDTVHSAYSTPGHLAAGAVITDALQPDAEELTKAPFVDASTLPPVIARARSRHQKTTLLNELAAWHVHPALVTLMDRILPDTLVDRVTLPEDSRPWEVVGGSSDLRTIGVGLPSYGTVSSARPPVYGASRRGTPRTVEIDLLDDARGAITEVDTENRGYKKAVGAFISVADRLVLTVTEGDEVSPSRSLHFGKRQLNAGKGSVSVSVASVKIDGDANMEATIQSAFGEKKNTILLSRAMATLKVVDWGVEATEPCESTSMQRADF